MADRQHEPNQPNQPSEEVITYIASWLAHYVGEQTGEISIPEMREFLYQHGYELVPPDEKTKFTASDYWRTVLWVAKHRLANPDRVLKTGWKR